MTDEGERRRRRGTDWFAVRGAASDQRAVRAIALFVALIVVADVMIPHLSLGPAWRRDQSMPDRLHLLALAAPAVLIALRARHDRTHRFAWGALALGVAGNAIAETMMHLLSTTTFPAPADGIKIGSYVLLATGIALLTKPTGQALHSVRLDAAIVSLSVGAAVTAVWFEPLARVSGDQLAVGITLSYPLLDVVLLVLIVAALAPFRLRPTTSTLILSSGVVLFATVDILHLDQVTSTGVATAPTMPELWAVGVLLFGLAAWAPSTARYQAVETAHAGLSGIPVTFAFVSLAVLAIGLFRDVNAVASLLALAAVAVVVARTAMTVRELRRANESFRLARTDELTSLTNRRGFLEGLDRLVEASPRPLAVLVADLNGFKDVNDSLGHHAGDALLQLVAERFRSRLGTTGLLARLGGDEFGVVAMVDNPGGGMSIAQDLHSTLDDPFVVEGVTVRIGASFGVALHPAHGTTRSAVLRCADVAMYDAKRTQTPAAMYRAALDFNTRNNLQLLDDLRDAIERHALCLYYQPKVDLRSGLITGSEALVRWRHPQRGLLFPDSFVPLAERANLILGLTRAVLAQAISYHAQHFSQLNVSVNISHRDLLDDQLAGYIADLLSVHRFPASQLTLEITETALAHDPERAAHSITQLRSSGIRVSIDDFGVGYSSMARLLELQVDEVKIDKSFVLATLEDGRAISIIRATAQLAAALDLHVVAEGIESGSMLGQLSRAGVHSGQGYFISRPLPADEFAAFLDQCNPDRSNETVHADHQLQASKGSTGPGTNPFTPFLPEHPSDPTSAPTRGITARHHIVS
jgi:diguanylate cyclase (GGDEF)-like protein